MEGKRITIFRIDLTYDEIRLITTALRGHGYGEDYDLEDKFNDLLESDSE